MSRMFLFFAFFLQMAAKQEAFSQDPNDRRQEYASIGDFPLENGQQIVDCKIGYRTFGKLNASRTNAVLYPTAGGSTTYMMQLFGTGTEVDTSKFYLILIDALGNGVSSSPSNSVNQPRTLFPEFGIIDMVNAQYRTLTEKMDIHHLTAVVGGSMGGCQALQWAVSYPGFMDKVISIEGTPKLSAYDLLWTYAYIEAVKSDTAYHEGNYAVNPSTSLAIHLSQLILTSPAYFNNSVQVDSFSSWLASLERNPFKVDCNNFLWQTKAVMKHDISASYGGSLQRAAKMIKAKMLIIANKQDHVINQSLSIKLAAMTNAELVVMDSDLGHLVFNEESTIEATRKFLAK